MRFWIRKGPIEFTNRHSVIGYQNAQSLLDVVIEFNSRAGVAQSLIAGCGPKVAQETQVFNRLRTALNPHPAPERRANGLHNPEIAAGLIQSTGYACPRWHASENSS